VRHGASRTLRGDNYAPGVQNVNVEGAMSQRILVVEDELILNRPLVQRLTREGYTAEGVRSDKRFMS
jgi:hypothetical protein